MTIINRMEKTFNSEGQQEIFVEVIYNTEKYGNLPYGKWISFPGCHDLSVQDIITQMEHFKEDAIRNKDRQLAQPVNEPEEDEEND